MTTIRTLTQDDGSTVNIKYVRQVTQASKQTTGTIRANSYEHEVKNSTLPIVLEPSLTISGYGWNTLGGIRQQYNLIGKTLSNHYVIERMVVSL
jgi:hypothetical protein